MTMTMTEKDSKSFGGWPVKHDLGAGIPTRFKPPQPPSVPLKPEQSQASRALALASYFVGGCMA